MKTGWDVPVRLSPDNGNDHRNARVSGNWVVWEETLAAGGSKVWYYDIAGAHAHTTPPVASLSPREPDVSGNTMVFLVTMGGTDLLVRYTDGDANAMVVTTSPSNKYRPRISGTRVVWSDDRNVATTGYDIYTTRIGDGGTRRSRPPPATRSRRT